MQKKATQNASYLKRKTEFKFTRLFQKTLVKVMKILGDFSTILLSRIRTKCTHANFSSSA